jgi:hypothetical protein
VYRLQITRDDGPLLHLAITADSLLLALTELHTDYRPTITWREVVEKYLYAGERRRLKCSCCHALDDGEESRKAERSFEVIDSREMGAKTKERETKRIMKAKASVIIGDNIRIKDHLQY